MREGEGVGTRGGVVCVRTLAAPLAPDIRAQAHGCAVQKTTERNRGDDEAAAEFQVTKRKVRTEWSRVDG